jgi:beta-1,4-N-acetylglucosaminyltransferase
VARASRSSSRVAVRRGDLLIFVTLGTHHQPFNRAIDLLRESGLEGEEIVIQHGTTPVTSLVARWLQYVDYQEALRLMSEARAVVTHAGVGSIMSALSVGQMPIVIPRLHAYGEHVDDHQLQIAHRLSTSGRITLATDHQTLERALASANGVATPLAGASTMRLASVISSILQTG